MPPRPMELGHVLMVHASLCIANLIGPRGGVGKDPFVFFVLALALNLARHFTLEVRVEAWVFTQQRNSFCLRGRIQLIVRNERDDYVAR